MSMQYNKMDKSTQSEAEEKIRVFNLDLIAFTFTLT